MMDVPKLETKEVPIDMIIPCPYNPRKELLPGDFKYEALKLLILKFGFSGVLQWNQRTGHCIGGNQRLKILIELGFKTIRCDVFDLSDADEMTFNIGLNKSGSEFDFYKLSENMVILDDGQNEMVLTCHDDEELKRMIDWDKSKAGDGGPPKKIFQVVVDCGKPGEQRRLHKDLTKQGFSAKMVTVDP